MVVRTPVPLVQSPCSEHGDRILEHILRREEGKDSDPLIVLAGEASQTFLELDLTIFTAKLDNPLPGSARPLPLCGLMASSTGK